MYIDTCPERSMYGVCVRSFTNRTDENVAFVQKSAEKTSINALVLKDNAF